MVHHATGARNEVGLTILPVFRVRRLDSPGVAARAGIPITALKSADKSAHSKSCPALRCLPVLSENGESTLSNEIYIF